MSNEASSASQDVKETEVVETTEVNPEETPEEVEAAQVEDESEDKPSRAEARIRELDDEKNAYKRALDLLTSRFPAAPPQVVTEEPEEEIDPAVSKKLKKELAKKDQEYGAVVTSMAEKMDDLESRDTIPNYKQNKAAIEAYKNEYVNTHGRWISRWQAYANLVALGKIEAPKKADSKPTVNRAKTRVVTETKTNSGSRPAGQKAFAQMSLAEKEEYLKDKSF